MGSARKHKWLRLLIIIILLIVSGIVVYLFIFRPLNIPTPDKTQELTNVANNAQVLANKGSVNDSVAEYDKAISLAGDDNVNKAQLLLNKANVYFNANLYDEALKAYLESYQISPTDALASSIANTYSIKGDNQKAVDYYQKAISLVDASSPMAKMDIIDYNEQIRILNDKIMGS